jgi:hypothetical protein
MRRARILSQPSGNVNKTLPYVWALELAYPRALTIGWVGTVRTEGITLSPGPIPLYDRCRAYRKIRISKIGD